MPHAWGNTRLCTTKLIGAAHQWSKSAAKGPYSSSSFSPFPTCIFSFPWHSLVASATTSLASNDRTEVFEGVSEAYNILHQARKRVIGPGWGGSSKDLNLCRIFLHSPHHFQQNISQSKCSFCSSWGRSKTIIQITPIPSFLMQAWKKLLALQLLPFLTLILQVYGLCYTIVAYSIPNHYDYA